MKQATFRFYAELNDFLPPDRRREAFIHAFEGRVSIKDMIESIGVPHTEVDLILVNGKSVDYSYIVQAGDRVSVYPVFESIDIAPVVQVRPGPLRVARFVVDTHLGRLARYLRLLGFDALYANDFQDDTLAELSSRERRILLTRDRGLLKRSKVTHGYFVRQTRPREQLLEVLRRFDLRGLIVPFRRCIRCNGSLAPVSKGSILDRLPPRTRDYYDEFRLCQGCGKIYWKGSHYQRMLEFIRDILQQEVDE